MKKLAYLVILLSSIFMANAQTAVKKVEYYDYLKYKVKSIRYELGDGSLHGECSTYDLDGTLVTKQKYKYNVLVSKTIFYQDGTPSVETNYNDKGVVNGTQKNYEFQQGKRYLKNKVLIVNDTLREYSEYWPDSKPKVTYSNTKLSKQFSRYDESGKKLADLKFINNKLTGYTDNNIKFDNNILTSFSLDTLRYDKSGLNKINVKGGNTDSYYFPNSALNFSTDGNNYAMEGQFMIDGQQRYFSAIYTAPSNIEYWFSPSFHYSELLGRVEFGVSTYLYGHNTSFPKDHNMLISLDDIDYDSHKGNSNYSPISTIIDYLNLANEDVYVKYYYEGKTIAEDLHIKDNKLIDFKYYNKAGNLYETKSYNKADKLFERGIYNETTGKIVERGIYEEDGHLIKHEKYTEAGVLYTAKSYGGLGNKLVKHEIYDETTGKLLERAIYGENVTLLKHEKYDETGSLIETKSYNMAGDRIN